MLGAWLVTGAAPGDSPFPTSGFRSVAAGGWSLLVDPLTAETVAILEDPALRLPPEPGSLVLQSEGQVPAAGVPAWLRVVDALPEFWAEPAIWGHFLKGPGAASGWGRDTGHAGWQGSPFPDRRAYRLDPGLRSVALAGYLPGVPNIGTLGLHPGPGGLQLTFNAMAGRLYEVQFTRSLLTPFVLQQTVIGLANGPQTVGLPADGSTGFYRLVQRPPGS